MAVDYCSSSLAEHQLTECGNYLKSGISAVAIVECDAGIQDKTSPVDWQAAIDAGTAVIIKQVKGELPAASDIEGDNPVGGGVATILDALDWLLTLEDANANVNNDGMWEQLNNRTVNIAIFSPRADEIYFVNEDVTIRAKPTIPGGAGTENQKYMVEFKWESDRDVFFDRTAAPTGIFTVN